MEMSFYAGLILLMGLTVYLAPKIVRKNFQFFTYALIVFVFYAVVMLVFKRESIVFAGISCACLCLAGLGLLLVKMKQHGPKSISSLDLEKMSRSQAEKYYKMKAQKIEFYKEWWFKVVLVNVLATLAVLIVSFR